ncbi:touch receptor neuron protein Mec-17-domain-containing protein, partial [Obelidium mucronatum]
MIYSSFSSSYDQNLKSVDILDVAAILKPQISVFTSVNTPRQPHQYHALSEMVEKLGEASAKAQGLRSAVTSIQKLQHNPTHRLYVLRSEPELEEDQCAILYDKVVLPLECKESEENQRHEDISERNISEIEQEVEEVIPPKYKPCKAIGLLKVGVKNLFVSDEYGRQIQISPLCVLDFYVHESMQRTGNGKKLFDYMLSNENTTAGHLAYDKPSPKMVSFLRKHYSLTDHIPQANNYMIFRQFGLSSLESGRKKQGPNQCLLRNDNITLNSISPLGSPRHHILHTPQKHAIPDAMFNASRFKPLSPIHHHLSTPSRPHSGSFNNTQNSPSDLYCNLNNNNPNIPIDNNSRQQTTPPKPIGNWRHEYGGSAMTLSQIKLGSNAAVSDGLAALEAESTRHSQLPPLVHPRIHPQASGYGRRRFRDF